MDVVPSTFTFRLAFKPGGRHRWWYCFVHHAVYGERRLICYAAQRPGIPVAAAVQGPLTVRFEPMPVRDITRAIRRRARL